MPDRKDEIAWLESVERDIRRKHGQCDCGRGPKKAETEMCEACELDALAELEDERRVVDLDFERLVKAMEGKDG